jgi:hypothetical protein
LVPALKAAGLRVLLDVEDFVPGRDLILEMTRAGSSSRHLLCVISPDYFDESRMVGFESLTVRRSDPAGRESRLIPLMLRNTELPEWLSGLIPVDWTSPQSRAREWKRLLEVLKAPRPDAAVPGAVDPPLKVAPSIGIIPSLSWEAVNPQIVRQVLLHSVAVCLLAVSARVAWSIPSLMTNLGLTTARPEITDALNHSVWFGFGSLVALLLVWIRLMDTQFVFSLGRVFLFVSILGLLCAAVSCVPGVSSWIHGMLFTVFIVAGSIYYFLFGMAQYYWRLPIYFTQVTPICCGRRLSVESPVLDHGLVGNGIHRHGLLNQTEEQLAATP